MTKANDFTPEELIAISLCVGWTLAMADGADDPALLRKETARRAMAAFERVHGAGYHAALREAAHA